MSIADDYIETLPAIRFNRHEIEHLYEHEMQRRAPEAWLRLVAERDVIRIEAPSEDGDPDAFVHRANVQASPEEIPGLILAVFGRPREIMALHQENLDEWLSMPHNGELTIRSLGYARTAELTTSIVSPNFERMIKHASLAELHTVADQQFQKARYALVNSNEITRTVSAYYMTMTALQKRVREHARRATRGLLD